MRAHSEPAGVAATQPFTLHVATFADLPFDADFMMVEAGHDHA